MNNNKIFTKVIMVSALYVIISLVIPYVSYGNLQFRIAEVLCVLALIDRRYILALTLGCFLTNLIGAYSGINLLGYMDVFIGTLATNISVVLMYKFKNILIKGQPILSLFMPVIVNAIIIGAELAYVLTPQLGFIGFIPMFGSIFISQFVICMLFGIVVYKKIKGLALFNLEK